MDAQIDELLRRGEIEQAANLARDRGLDRRAAELLALAGRHAEAVLIAVRAREWQLALDLAITSGDDRIVLALCDEIGKQPDHAAGAAAQARIARRLDVAARVLEPTDPAGAAATWYEIGEYARAGRCFDRAQQTPQAIRAFEQHLAQNPDDAEVAIRLGDLRATRGDLDGAVRAVQSAVRAGSGAPALERLIDGLARLGLDGSARAALRKLRAIDADTPSDLARYDGKLPRSEGAQKRYAGRYRVVREVGSGATGRVLEALDELTGESVALKVLSVGDDRSGAFGRFMREAELAQLLDDPTLVRMRALDPEGPTIVYDWMPGGTLADRIGSLSVAEVRAVSMRLLAAIETLHRHGVVHRDIKPSNVLYDPAGQARLGDLGAAHLGDLGATVTGGLVGSLPYMAPEQITGAPVSAATDLYAFGCVLYQMLTGALPYPGPDFVSQHLADAIPKVSAVRPSLGDEYDSVIASLLAKDPLARPQQAADARKMLGALSWREPDEAAHPVRSRASLPPEAVREESARRVPSAIPGRFTDVKLGRELERVRVPSAHRDVLTRWAAGSWSELQPVYDVEPDGDDAWAWVEPIDGDVLRLDELDADTRARVDAALRALEIPDAVRERVVTVRSVAFGCVVPASVMGD
jgi:serine/threonine-protein kinase